MISRPVSTIVKSGVTHVVAAVAVPGAAGGRGAGVSASGMVGIPSIEVMWVNGAGRYVQNGFMPAADWMPPVRSLRNSAAPANEPSVANALASWPNVVTHDLPPS